MCAMKVAVQFATVAAMAVIVIVGPSKADDRTPVKLPLEIKSSFMAEMRTHMGNLDDILAALAEGDFEEAANIADLKMDFGHRMWESMLDGDMTAEQVLAMKKAMQSKGMAMGQGGDMGHRMGQGMGKGMGRFMPDDFRAMGAVFHEAASAFAKRARAAASPPSAVDYKETTEALQTVTSSCRGCHDAFRIE